MFILSPTHQQSVFKRCHSDKHFSEFFTYKMAAEINWHLWNKITSLSPYIACYISQGSQAEAAIRRYGDKDIHWSMQGMLRLMPSAMMRLFQPTLDNIKNAISTVLASPDVSGQTPSPLTYLSSSSSS